MKIEGYYQKTDFIVGSKEEVDRVQRYMMAEKKKRMQIYLGSSVEKTEESSIHKVGSKKYIIPSEQPEEKEEDNMDAFE